MSDHDGVARGTRNDSPMLASRRRLAVAATRAIALAESIIRLFKTEVIHLKGPWRHLEAVEFATLTWVDPFNTRRLLEPIGHVPPAEYEAAYSAELDAESTSEPASRRGARRQPRVSNETARRSGRGSAR
jgi:hypothetical protein